MRALKKAWPTRFTTARPPSALDRVRHRAAGAHVVEDRRARLLREDRLGQQRGEEVARHELAAVVDEEAAVGVAVPGDAELGLAVEHRVDDQLAVLLQQRVRLVAGELAVGLEVEPVPCDREASRCSGPIIGPAMPLPPSSTTSIGRIASASMKPSA